MTARYQILPPLSTDDESRLTASITQRGVEVPVIKDEHGNIIDGHNRAAIADALGIPYPSEVRSGLTDSQKRLLAVDLNLARRQLTTAQKTVLGRTIEADVAEESAQRQVDLGKTHGTPDPLGAFAPKGKTRDHVASRVGLGSGDTYERAKRVIDAIETQPDGAQLMEHIASGDWDIPEIKEELKHRGVDLKKPSNVTAMPSWVDKLPEETVDKLADSLYRIQLPDMVSQVVLRAQEHITKGSRKAQEELQRIDWNDVTDEMRSDKAITDAIYFMDAELGRFAAVIGRARLAQPGIRSVK